MNGRVNRRLDRLLVQIILGATSGRCQRGLHLKEFDRLSNPKLVNLMEANIKKGQQIVTERKWRVCHRSAEENAGAVLRKLEIITVRVTAKDPDSCYFPDPDSDNEPTEKAPCENCTCYTVKLCIDSSNRGSAFCTCDNASALLCKHIHGACSFLSGGTKNSERGGLAVFRLLRTDLRQDRDLDDFELEIDGEMCLGPAPLSSPTSNPIPSDDEQANPMPSDDEQAVGPSASVAGNSVALAKILECIETTFAGLSLAPKTDKDALCDQIIFSLRDRKSCFDTKIKQPQRPGRKQQSAVARPKSGTLTPTPPPLCQVL